MKKITRLMLICSFVAPITADATEYSDNILDDVKIYRSYKKKETTLTIDACGAIKKAINKNDDFKTNNLTIDCIRQPGKITLSVPSFRKISVSQLPQGMLNNWLQTIYATASDNNAGLVHLHLSDNIRQEKGTILSINTKDNLAGMFSDWKKINFATAAAQSYVEPVVAADNIKEQTNPKQPKTEQRSTPIYSSGLNDSLPPPPPYKF